MLVKRKALVVTLLTILGLAVITVLIVEIGDNSSFNNSDQNTLHLESFSPVAIGSQIVSGSIVLVNPTSNIFENLNLTTKIDDSELITPILRLVKPLPLEEPLSHFSVPINQISIEPNQNETIQLYLYGPDQNEPPSYQAIVNVQTFSSHIFRFYLTQNSLGDKINGQSFTTPQEKAYLQISGYSPIKHSNNTWHEYFNSTENRYEYVNDQPNFYQQTHDFFPLDPSSYSWAKSLNQIGEHYFNVTVVNNCSFSVKGIALFSRGGSVAFALSDYVLKPNETYILPVQTSGEDWWSVENIYQMSSFFPAYASGDLID